MNFLRRRLRALFRRRDLEAEMAEEMRFHLEQRAADFAADGLAAEEARLAAQRKFGNTAALQERARDTFGWGALERLAQDLRFAARQLVRAPGFSVLAIITLGLGIGANTSMFSLANGVMFKPLPYAEAGRLQQIYRITPQHPKGGLSPADYLDLKATRAAYGDFSALTINRVSLSDPAQPAELAYSGRATANLFSLLGVVPQLGRDFLPGEDTPGRHHVVILSQRTWQNRYHAAPDIIGRRVRIDGEWHEVIGVLPASFNDWRHLGNLDFFRPFAFTPDFSADRKASNLQVFGRLAPDLTPAEAESFVADFGARLAREHPEEHTGTTWRAMSLQSTVVGSSGGVILPMLIGLSGFVLLIACSNLANLLLARTMTRAREFAVRAALGATRLQLLRPLLAEAVVLSLAGGVLSIAVAYLFRDWAALRSVGDNGEFVWFDVDWAVMGWAFAASLVTALAFGLAPALFALRLDLNDTLKSGARGQSGSRGQHRFRQALIVGQFALSMVLLTAAALFIRGLHDLHHRRSGWQSAQVVTGHVALPAGTYGDDTKVHAFQRLALERLSALPGVERVAFAQAAPFYHWTDVRKFHVEGRERAQPGREPAAMVNTVSPAYLEAFEMRLVAGRAFLEQDSATAPRVYLIGQSSARAWFGEQDPVGRRIAQIADGREVHSGEIVGVVADFQTVDPDPNPVVSYVYQPLAQEPTRNFELAVRAAPGVLPATLVPAIRETLAALDPDLPVRRLQSADHNIDRTLYQLGVLRDMLGAFGVLGLALASLGIYGVIARTTAQRSGEFAIRLALGASGRDLTRLVFGAGVRQAVLGSALGLLGAFGVAQMLVSVYPGIRTNSPAVLIVTTLILLGVALLACWLPARRAGRIDAIEALRAE
ncbi:MAG: permease [Opitutus sp.]|nr:permease [Opitutus sp.]